MTKPSALAALTQRLPAPAGELADRWPEGGLELLHMLEAKGLLDETPDGAPDGALTLRQHLRAVAEAPIAAGLEEAPGRSTLFAELLLNLVEPGRINQGYKGTCAATCIETFLVERDPVEYARLVAGLSAPGGQVELKGGGLLKRDEERLYPSPAEGRRSPVSRLFQVACMEFAYDRADYDNSADRQRAASGELAGSGVGLHLDAFDRLLEAITGARWDIMSDLHLRMAKMMGFSVHDIPDIRRDGLGVIERSLAAGEGAFATLKVADAALADGEGHLHRVRDQLHKVRVLSVDSAGGRVVFEDPLDPTAPWYRGVDACVLDPYGRASLPTEAFVEMMVELSYRPEFFTPA